MLIPLWDGDILLYQVGFAAETYWRKVHEEQGVEIDVEQNPPPFDVAQTILDERISNTHAILETTRSPEFYFTGKGNFRNEICTTGYKKRIGRKPYHHQNIKAYLKGKYPELWFELDGLEADDLLAVRQCEDVENTIIISSDKDLLQVPGWHYSFEYGNVPSFGPLLVDGFGKIWLDDKNKLRGYGEKFFYAQLIMGDPTDSIIGIPKSGPSRAFKLLSNTNTPVEAFKAVREAYRAFYGDSGDDKLLENGRLLWIVRKLDEFDNPVIWSFPNESNNS